MADATFADPDLTTFCRLEELGLQAVGQFLEPDRAIITCRVVDTGDQCGRCGQRGAPRDTVSRLLAHEPLGWRPTLLLVTVRRYHCAGCARVWRQDTSRAAEPRAKLSRRALRWALEGIVCQHLSMARIAEGLAVSWNTANTAVLNEGRRVLINDPARFDQVNVIGVDEHVWRHTRLQDKYVTVIIDLTAVRAGTGPARLLDMVQGRTKQVFASWLADRPQAWRDRVQVVAMDGFTGFKTAATEQLPDAVTVWTHSTSFAWPAKPSTSAADASNKIARPPRPLRDPLFSARRTLHTGADLLTEKQRARLHALFADDEHAAGRSHLGHLPGHDHRLPAHRPQIGTTTCCAR